MWRGAEVPRGGGHRVGAITAGCKRGTQIAREELEPRLFAELAHVLFARGLEASRAGSCAVCGLARDVPITFVAVQVRCAGCGATSLFEPDDLLRAAAATGAHALAQVEAHDEWLAMKRAERSATQMRMAPLDLLKRWEIAQIAYWRKYVQARGVIEPAMAKDPRLEITSRMNQWYEYKANHEVEWNRAGRPREAI